MNERIDGERTASELQDWVTELIEQQAAISEVLRAIANSPHEAAHLRRHPRQRHTSLPSGHRLLTSLRRKRPSSRGNTRGFPFGWSGEVITPSVRRKGEPSGSISHRQVTHPHSR